MDANRFWNRLRYFVTDAWDEWRHSKAVNLLALGTLAAALFVAGLVMLVIGNVGRRVQGLRDDVRVEIYLRDDRAAEERQALIDQLQATDGVARVEFVDKDEALRRYRAWASGMAELAEELESNPLPASLEVYLEPWGSTVERAEEIRRRFHGAAGVEEVRFSSDWLRRLESTLDLARAGGSAVGVLVLLAVVVVMSSVLRLAVLSRREEIEIMRLVGATPAFIRGPFLVAGALSGLVASGIALMLVESVRRAALAYSGAGSAVLLDLLAAHPLSRDLAALLLLVGVLVSIAGSFFAVRESA